jgi:hypothetical protein
MKTVNVVIFAIFASVTLVHSQQVLRAGIIGLDTSHAIHFTKALNADNPEPQYAGVRVTVAYPQGSRDIESSTKRVPKYTEQVKGMGVEIVDSIDALLAKCDVVFLESNDGRVHLEQAIPVFKSGKRVFIDKPVGGTLAQTLAIYDAAAKYKVPMFSSSSLRFTVMMRDIANGKYGDVMGASTYGPCALEPTHPDLFWYGVHGVEMLLALMGPECVSVVRASTDACDVVTGVWEDGRVGTFRGNRNCKSAFGGIAYFKKSVEHVNDYNGYNMMLAEIIKFFKGAPAPVKPEETIAIFAFMEAADASRRQGGVPVRITDVMAKARKESERLFDR